MKKIIIILIVAILLILLIPIPNHLKDGGSIEYNAILYKITKVHKLNSANEDKDYIDGLIIEILGRKVYNKVDKITNNIDNNIEENVNNEEVINNESEINIGLYKNYRNGKERELVTEYSTSWKYHQDISSFEVYYTNNELISNDSQIKVFDEYKNNYEDIDYYRIGYKISFKTKNETIEKIIISPKDTEDFYDYLEIYLYDDYHRSGGWYSHTIEDEFNENTLLTSIKLTAGKKAEEIISDITVTAYLYNIADEFNNIIGNNSYSIIVKRN